MCILLRLGDFLFCPNLKEITSAFEFYLFVVMLYCLGSQAVKKDKPSLGLT